jgi:glycosyltransferase involved in cell wall biosynthesis
MPIRIAHCIHSLSLGGAQQVIAQIAAGTAVGEYEHYCYTALGGVSEGVVERSGARISIIPRRMAKFDPTWVRALESALRRDRIDILHTYLFGDSLHGLAAARRVGDIPVLVSLHTNRHAVSRVQDLGYRWVLQRADVVVACSNSVRTSFADVVSRDPDTFLVIPNGIEVDGVRPLDAEEERRAVLDGLGVPPGRLVIASVGRLIPLKGIHHLLEAFARCMKTEREDAHFVVIGDGPQRRDLERLTRELGIEQRVTFAGFRANVREILPAVDVVAFGSAYEAFSVTLLEAMAAGRCIVAPAVPGIVDGVSTEREAILSPTRDVEGLAAALRRVVGDRDLREALGNAARGRLEREFTADKMTERYQDLYRSLHAVKSVAPGPVPAIRR